MREIRIGDKNIRIRATTPALLFYKQEFKRDLVGDLLKMFQGMVGIKALQALGSSDVSLDTLDLGSIDSVVMLQIIWAMSKADSLGHPFPSFQTWVFEIEGFSAFDPDVFKGVVDEATNGFFRSGASIAPNARKKR